MTRGSVRCPPASIELPVWGPVGTRLIRLIARLRQGRSQTIEHRLDVFPLQPVTAPHLESFRLWNPSSGSPLVVSVFGPHAPLVPRIPSALVLGARCLSFGSAGPQPTARRCKRIQSFSAALGGMTFARSLCSEGHDVVIRDRRAWSLSHPSYDCLQNLTCSFDFPEGVIGNCMALPQASQKLRARG
jgi:hypothetical protein